MKEIGESIKLVVLMLSCIISFYGCTKQSVENEEIIEQSYIKFKTNNILKKIEGGSVIHAWNGMQISGSSCEAEAYLNITFKYPGPGTTYQINCWDIDYLINDGNFMHCNPEFNSFNENRYLIVEGAVTLNKNVTVYTGNYTAHTSAKGTFYFKCINAVGDIITVTEGEFDIK